MSSLSPSASQNLIYRGTPRGGVSSRDHPPPKASWVGDGQSHSERADNHSGGFATMSPSRWRHAAYAHSTTYRTLLYDVSSDTKKITPTWGKVSETPWFGEARRLQGFGRPVLSVTTSKDAPLFMSHRSSGYTEKRVEPRISPSEEAQYVLPGGPDEEAKARADPRRAQIIRLNWRNQVLFEPKESLRSSRADVNSKSANEIFNTALSSTNGNIDHQRLSIRGNSDMANSAAASNNNRSRPEGGVALAQGSSRHQPQLSARLSTNRSHGGVVPKQRRC